MEFLLCQVHMLSPLDTSVCFVGSSLLSAHLEPDSPPPGLIRGGLFSSFIEVADGKLLQVIRRLV